jgi:hypothetical protein
MGVRFALLCVGALLGCGDATVAPELEPLTGTWQAPTEALQPRGTLDRVLVITADGRSETHVVSRGLYEGQASGDLALESVLYARIVIRGSYLLVHPDSLVTRDLFYGPENRSVQRESAGWPRDSTRFGVRGSNLVLEYSAYPADVPGLLQQTYTRVR